MFFSLTQCSSKPTSLARNVTPREKKSDKEEVHSLRIRDEDVLKLRTLTTMSAEMQLFVGLLFSSVPLVRFLKKK